MSFLIVILMTTVVLVAVVGSYDAYEKHRAPRFGEDVTRHFRRLKGHREARGSTVEQCRTTNLEKERLGHVNVFAFLDPSWYYSYRQMIMLELLQKRLGNSGFSNILFFVVTPPPNIPEDSAENEAEIKTWREISKNMLEPEYFLDAREFLSNDAIENKKHITYIQDTRELGIWENFHASKDEVVIVDRCGKLTYQVIIPWSILYFPYVKAAILSTYKDDPCGPCDEYSSTIYNSIDYEELFLKNTNTGITEINNNLNLYTEGTVGDLETATIPLDESERNKDESVSSTISPIEVNTYKSTIYDITTTDASTISIETTENVKLENDTFATETSIEITSEVAMEREKAQISTASISEVTENYQEIENRVRSSEEINANHGDSSFTIKNSVDNWETNHEDRPSEPDVSLQSTKANEDQRTSDENIEQQELKLQRDESLPLRIILYAPHLHDENGTLKKYTHLVLKARDPDYHDHFHSKSTNSNEEPITLKQSDSTVLKDKKLSDYVHSKNESPGVYGEIAYHWRTEEEELNNNNENTEFTDDEYATVEDTGGDVDDTVDSKSSILKPNDIDTIESDMNVKSNNELDEFTQQKLIDHYSKLLKWLYYIL